jgi:hypothetical protein
MIPKALSLSLCVALAACASPRLTAEAPSAERSDPQRPPPAHIVVDHILIGVKSARFPEGKRSAAEAGAFARDLLAKIRAGADWAAAKRANSEDPPPGGPYAMADRGTKPSGPNEFARDGMVPAFGDVGFALAVGEIGLAEYDATKSPFGFHLIRRDK